MVSIVELDPWGGNTNRDSNGAFQPQKFTTYIRDGNAADDAMHRRYNRWWSRFDQPDPYDGSYNLTKPQSFNRYSYAQNDPVNFVDPNGLEPGIVGGWMGIILNPPSGDVTIYGSFAAGQNFGVGSGLTIDSHAQLLLINFLIFRRGTPQDPQPQPPQEPQPLPFNTCQEFVDYLVGQANETLRRMNPLSQGSVNNNISALGFGMMYTARFEYDRHINNRADGFKQSLTRGGQGAGVYGHILGVGGAKLWGLAGTAVVIAQSAKDLYDYYRAAPQDRGQHSAELAGNAAALKVGTHLWNFLSGTTPQDPQRLANSLRSELCQ